MNIPYEVRNNDEYSDNIGYSKNIESIVPSCELLVNFRLNGSLGKKQCLVYAEKIDLKGLIIVRVTEKADQRRMYIATVDSNSFHILKQDQSLHVSFGGFIENLVKILHGCQAGKLDMSIIEMQQMSSEVGCGVFQLQFYEIRTFKNLIHLCLPIRMAELNVVLYYINASLEAVEKKNLAYEHSLETLRAEMQALLQRIEQMSLENSKLRENLMENSNTMSQRHNEELQQQRENLQKISDQRTDDNERNRKTVSSLQLQIERLNAEKSNILTEKCQEMKRNESLNEEISNLKMSIASLKEQKEKQALEVATLKNMDRKNEMHLCDTRKHIGELQEKLKKYEKAKADLVAELEAEKKISQTKRHALEMSMEEISKANEIILKQTQELAKLRKTVNWRTDIALEQEKAVNEKENQLRLKDQEIKSLQHLVEDLRQEIMQKLASMRKYAASIEHKYTEQIKALKGKLTTVNQENKPLMMNHTVINRQRM